MERVFLFCYTVIAAGLSLVDFHFAIKAFRKPEKVGRAMGWSALFAGLITLAYLLSVNTKKPMLVSAASSLVFSGIDCMLVSLAYFCALTTGFSGYRGVRTINKVIRGLACLDIAVLLSNTFTKFAVGFDILDPIGVSYRMYAPYVIHLIYTYIIIALSLTVLILKSVQTPSQYRNQYLLIIMAIGVVVLINAVFLFQNEDSFFTKVDCSILGYSIGLFLMYWTAYEYRENYMVNSLSRMVVGSVSQGVVLFDYMDKLIMYNQQALDLLRGVSLSGQTTREQLQEVCGMPMRPDDRYSTQCDIEGCVPLRCDFSRLKGQQGQTIGSLYAFTDISHDRDITSGFEYAKDTRYAWQIAATMDDPIAVVFFDIVGLKDVNRILGRDEGDRRIRALAKEMTRRMPRDAVFRRGLEAYLIAICPSKTEREMMPYIDAVINASEGKTMFGISTTNGRTLEQAIEDALRSIQLKKLLCPDSTRSYSLASLVRALKEADADTEDHVRRTQKMGAMLGRRIGLTDAQLTQLELLCLLHDIGKVGIPLEILNKPGKLTDMEWSVLRTHAEKGYQIAMTSHELRSIAQMILCHHERWDGRGYPKQLSGDSIPLLSRIISVVDAYDAMVNDRSYRKALTPEAAQAEIRNNAGTQFDPTLATEFLAMLEEYPELAQGEKVGAEEGRPLLEFMPEAVNTGFTTPIAYSRYLLDANNVIVQVDDRFQEITGYSAQDVVGKMAQVELVPQEDRAYYLLQLNNQFAHGSMAYLRHEIQRKDGDRVQVACYGKVYFDSAEKAYKSEIIVFQL